jgi:hypothetical protein
MRAGILHKGHPFFGQLLLDTAGRAQRMLPNCRGIGTTIDRQHIGQQLRSGGVGHK